MRRKRASRCFAKGTFRVQCAYLQGVLRDGGVRRDSKLLCGSVVGMRDGIYFEAESAADVERAFHETVDDYLAFCVEKGKSPEESALTHSAFA